VRCALAAHSDSAVSDLRPASLRELGLMLDIRVPERLRENIERVAAIALIAVGIYLFVGQITSR
jgi:hypothetical protein